MTDLPKIIIEARIALEHITPQIASAHRQVKVQLINQFAALTSEEQEIERQHFKRLLFRIDVLITTIDLLYPSTSTATTPSTQVQTSQINHQSTSITETRNPES